MVTKTTANNSLKTLMGPLWSAFKNESNWEIIIDSFNEVYSFNGKGLINEKVFKTNKDLDLFIARLLKFSKKKISEDESAYFFQIDEFTRVNIVLPPVAIKGPSVVITKLPKKQVTFDNLVSWGAIDAEGKALLEKVLNSKKGFLVAGNMGSGKTTLLNTLVNSIPMPNRVVTLERVPDLVLSRPNVCRLQSLTQKSSEMVELVRVAERMRGDYLVLSECVGPEVGAFIEMVRSNCIGVALTTGENVLDAVKRMVTKTVLSSDGFTLEEANYAMAQTFSYVIFQEKRADGKRIISSISETSYERGELKLKVLLKR